MFPSQYTKPGLLGSGLNFAKNINWASLLDNTQKTLGVINQAIPIIYQVKPIIGNARTMFKIADELRKPTVPAKSDESSNSRDVISQTSNRPVFYI